MTGLSKISHFIAIYTEKSIRRSYFLVALTLLVLAHYRFNIFRMAIKFGRRVHFALWRKMVKPPIARLLAI